jgi:hypothetical protein
MLCDPLVFRPVRGTGNLKSRFHRVAREGRGEAAAAQAIAIVLAHGGRLNKESWEKQALCLDAEGLETIHASLCSSRIGR